MTASAPSRGGERDDVHRGVHASAGAGECRAGGSVHFRDGRPGPLAGSAPAPVWLQGGVRQPARRHLRPHPSRSRGASTQMRTRIFSSFWFRSLTLCLSVFACVQVMGHAEAAKIASMIFLCVHREHYGFLSRLGPILQGKVTVLLSVIYFGLCNRDTARGRWHASHVLGWYKNLLPIKRAFYFWLRDSWTARKQPGSIEEFNTLIVWAKMKTLFPRICVCRMKT